ncbi:sulfate adenylyltransferase subunit CysN [Haliea sp. AH-315-K21]|uniref:Sulfate adenylyltransferase subunit 1 n=1 Tax=SAR86 cluster bacterium TaxID=2030880 RepID=A0A2A5CBA9_9GAMM|nr:sulfate adenylyltransferase subunit CysN [Haliea sp. AH-315-K21]PCJ40636.1 MAG: bifunctional sulfate adenylyltransferase subunit 1/adenylylsulfate kinase [SAR86 cluster bacterium]
MSHKSDLISTDIDAYLAQHERKELLRLLTCGSVDDGKSTLIGRLLHDSKMIYEDQLEAIKADSVKSGTTGNDFDLALLVDGLQAEREQGITIDVAYRYFSTAKRKFIIADTPGHEQYTRNMATGASNCELAIILIDARYGVQTQTRRHTFIASLLGIKHIIVAVNKMDLMDFSEDVFNTIKQDYIEFTKELNTGDLYFIPMSALNGDNVVNASEKTPWYDGETLMWMLENIKISADRNFDDFRFPVQFVNRPNLDFRGFCGTIASGIVRKGDEIIALPSGKRSKIKSIVTYDEELEQAFMPMAVTLTLEDEIDISRGDMIVHTDNLPTSEDSFSANIVWMNEAPLLTGKQYDFKQASRSFSGIITNIQHKVDVNTLETVPTPSLELNEIGLCDLEFSEAIHFDSYLQNPSTGAFIIIDRLSNVTVGAGMIKTTAARKRRVVESSTNHVTTEDRAARYGQKPVTVMFVGISGSGKSTLAHALERRLFDMGRISAILDGKAMRLGISKDLPHDADGRAENLRRSAYIAKYLNDSGLICCAAFVAPNADSREHMSSVIGEDNCIVVYLNPPLDVCKQRDPSGIYAAEANVQTGTVPGVSFPYEDWENPNLILPTHELDVDECIDRVVNVLKEQSIL